MTSPRSALRTWVALPTFISDNPRRRRWLRRYLDAERFGGLQVENELEPCRLLHRQVGGLGTLEDVAGIDADLTKTIREVGSVAHQPAGYEQITVRIKRRNPVV